MIEQEESLNKETSSDLEQSWISFRYIQYLSLIFSILFSLAWIIFFFTGWRALIFGEDTITVPTKIESEYPNTFIEPMLNPVQESELFTCPKYTYMVTFNNNTNKILGIYWVKPDWIEQYYQSISPNWAQWMCTSLWILWRMRSLEENNKLIQDINIQADKFLYYIWS